MVWRSLGMHDPTILDVALVPSRRGCSGSVPPTALGIGLTGRIPHQPLLARLQEILASPAIQVGRDSLTPAQLSDAALPIQSRQNDPDLLLGRVLFAGLALDVSLNGVCRHTLRHLKLPSNSASQKVPLRSSPQMVHLSLNP